jgi:quercetin dioxygenase-like cupin family protein
MRTLWLLVAVGCGGTKTTAPVAPSPAAQAADPPAQMSSSQGDPSTLRKPTVVEGTPGTTLWHDASGDGKLVAVPLHSRPNQPPGRFVIALSADGVCSATTPCTVYDHSLPAGVQRATYKTWQDYGPDRRFALLWGDPKAGPAGVVVEMKAGTAPFWHMHGKDVRIVVLAGTVDFVQSGQEPHTLSPGGYVMQPGGFKHSESCKAGADCVLYIHGDQGVDVVPM